MARHSVPDFETLVRECMPGLSAYARSICSDRWTAEDAVQETLIRAWRYLPTFRGESPVMGWLVTICRRVVIDLARKAPVAEQLPENVLDATDHFGGAHVMDMIRELPLPQREVVVLCGLLGLDYAATADSLGVPVGTVRSRLSRARETLGSRLDEALAV